MGEPGARPQLLFLHTSIPHVPWHFTPDGKRYETRVSLPGVIDGTWVGPQWLADQGFQRHLLQTEYADKLLGDLLRRLRETGLYDRALVVVLADHGVSFRAGDRRRRPTPTNVHDVANMPLFIKLPGPARGRDRGHRGADDRRAADDRATSSACGCASRSTACRWASATRIPATRSTSPTAGSSGPRPTSGRSCASASSGGATSARCSRRPATTRSRWARGRSWSAAARGRREPGDGRVELEDPGQFEDVDPDSPLLPIWVAGTVTALPGGSDVAIVVNGRVEATTKVDRGRFGALVPPRALRAGANRVEVFEIDGDTFRKL